MNLSIQRILEKELSDLELEIHDYKYALILKSKKSEKQFKKILISLRDLLVNTFDEQSQIAIRDVIDYLLSIKRENFTSADAKKIDSLLKVKLGSNLSDLTAAKLKSITNTLFKFGAGEIAENLSFKLSFDVSDNEAMDILGVHNNFWVGQFYSEQIQNGIKEVLNQYFDGDKSITDVALDFEKRFSKFSDKGIEYFEGLAEHTSNRIRAFGQISGMEKAGINAYQIVAILDDRTSEVCKYMDGKIFPLSRATEYRDKILSLKSPADIKSFSSWISPSELNRLKENKTEDNELPLGLTVPPFHWRCRTIIKAFFSEDVPITPPQVNSGDEEVKIELGKLSIKVLPFENNFYKTKNIIIRTTKKKVQGYIIGNNIFVNLKYAINPSATLKHETGHALSGFFMNNADNLEYLNLFYDYKMKNQIVEIVKNRLLRNPNFKGLDFNGVKELLKGEILKLGDNEWKLSKKKINYYTNTDEIFAECYCQYFLNPEFKNYAIDFYKFIEKIILRFIKEYEK